MDVWRVLAVGVAVTSIVALGGAPPVAAEEGFGSISGRITGPDGRPLGPEAQVCVSYGNATDQRGVNEDGIYLIPRVEAGTWSVTFGQCRSWPDPPPTIYAPQMYPDLHDPWVVETDTVPNVVVRSEQVTGGVDARMREGGRLVVDVVDPEGRPLEGMCVSTNAKQHPSAESRGPVGYLETGLSAVTDASGRAELVGLAPADRFVRASNCERLDQHRWLTPSQYLGGFTPEDSTSVRVDLGDSVSARIEMAPAASIEGRVTHQGRPVPDTCVWWFGETGQTERTDTDSNGQYVIGELVPRQPGQVVACGQSTLNWTHRIDGTPAPMWYPDAPTAVLGESLTPLAGEVVPLDFNLRTHHAVGIVVRGLPSATGCEVVLDLNDGTAPSAPVEPRTVRGVDVHVATMWELPGRASGGELRCDGRRAGVMRRIGRESPFHPIFEHEWPTWEVVHDVEGPRVTAVGPVSTGWSRRPVTVRFECADDGVGVATCPAPVVLGEGRTTTVTASDRDGNSTATRVGPMRVDQTPPRWRIGEGRRTFRLGERLDLRCSMVDDRSGLAWSAVNCPGAGTTTDRLGVGNHEFHLMGQDRAGNASGVILRISVVK